VAYTELYHTDCKQNDCPLRSSCSFMGPKVTRPSMAEDKSVDFLIVGDSCSGPDDFISRTPFSGADGRILQAVLEPFKEKYTFAFTYVIKGWSIEWSSVPANVQAKGLLNSSSQLNRIKAASLGSRKDKKLIAYKCSSYLAGEIELLRPKRIIALGNSVLEVMFPNESRKITKMRDEVLHYKGIPTSFVSSPQSVLRSPSARPGWEAGFRAAITGEKIEHDKEISPTHLVKSLPEALDLIEMLRSTPGDISVDFETENLNKRYGNRLATLQFADSGNIGYVIPYAHPESPFSPSELLILKEELRKLFSIPSQIQHWIGHGLKFESNVLQSIIGTPLISAPLFDTQAGAFLLDENRLQRVAEFKYGVYTLKQLALDYLNFDGYDKGVLKTREEGKLSDLPMKELSEYGCFEQGSVTVAGGAVKDISEIEAGDIVLTHNNRYRRVKSAWSKPYKGKIYDIYCEEGYKILGVTPNHPILSQPDENAATWTRTDKLRIGDHIFKQVDNTCGSISEAISVLTNEVHDHLTVEGDHLDKGHITEVISKYVAHPDFWWVLGICMAEGWVRHKVQPPRVEAMGHTEKNRSTAIGFSIHRNEVCILKPIIENLFQLHTSEIRTTRNTKGVDLVVSNRIVSTFLDVVCQTKNRTCRGAWVKHLHPVVFSSLGKHEISEFLSGYYDGDGHARVMGGARGRQSSHSTTSVSLANQIRLLLTKIEAHFTIVSSKHGTAKSEVARLKSGRQKHQRHETYYTTLFGSSYNWWNSRYGKTLIFERSDTSLPKVFRPQLKITNIKEREVDTTVWNCEVEEDNSYIVNGIRVHNSMDAWVTFRLKDALVEEAHRQNYYEQFISLMYHYYSPLITLFSDVEQNGSPANVAHLRNLISKRSPLLTRIAEIEGSIKNSQQVQEANRIILKDQQGGSNIKPLGGTPWAFDFSKKGHPQTLFFNIMKLKPRGDAGASGLYSVDEEWRDTVKGLDIPLVKDYDEWVLMRKMYDSFATKLYAYVDPTGDNRDTNTDACIRPSYSLSTVVTGRVACSQPNLMAIPRAENDAKRAIKDIFQATKDRAMIQFDYKANEVRWVGIIAQDYKLAESFRIGKEYGDQYRLTPTAELLKLSEMYGDVHKVNAALLMGKSIDQVTKPERQKYKAIVLALIYDKSDLVLAQELGVEIEDAKTLREKFFEQFGSLLEWKLRTKEFAKRYGYIETPHGRRRRFPIFDLFRGPSGYFDYHRVPGEFRSIVEDALRQSTNSGVQGIASDAAMLGAVFAGDFIRKNKVDWKIQNAVHDSVIINAPISEVPDVIKHVERCITIDVKEYFENVWNMNMIIFPEVECELGLEWGSLKKWNGSQPELDDAMTFMKDRNQTKWYS